MGHQIRPALYQSSLRYGSPEHHATVYLYLLYRQRDWSSAGGGFWDIGDKDVRVDADQLQISGNYIIWDTPLDEDQLDNLPEYNRDEVSIAY